MNLVLSRNEIKGHNKQSTKGLDYENISTSLMCFHRRRVGRDSTARGHSGLQQFNGSQSANKTFKRTPQNPRKKILFTPFHSDIYNVNRCSGCCRGGHEVAGAPRTGGRLTPRRVQTSVRLREELRPLRPHRSLLSVSPAEQLQLQLSSFVSFRTK